MQFKTLRKEKYFLSEFYGHMLKKCVKKVEAVCKKVII